MTNHSPSPDKPRGPLHTYLLFTVYFTIITTIVTHSNYYDIVVIIVTEIKMHMRKVHWRIKLPSEETHPVTDPLGQNCRNPAKDQKKSGLKPNQIQ